MPDNHNANSSSNNLTGRNQHGDSVLKGHPELKEILQSFSNQRMSQNEMLRRLAQTHQIEIGLRTLQRHLNTLEVKTTRRNGMNDVEMGVAIDRKLEEDPLGRWGYRKVQEKLALQTNHIPKRFLARYLQAKDNAAAKARKGGSKNQHGKGLWSAGPNEEWGGDGHLKLLDEMGISIWGLVDKASRRELGLYATPGPLNANTTLALYLLTVKKQKGIPIQVLTDHGSETGKTAAVQSTLRLHYCPDLTFEEVPPHRFVKSTYNITRERKWRPLFYGELENILVAWRQGPHAAGYLPHNSLHQELAIWVWAQVVQTRLDEYVYETNAHKVRAQKGTHLPSGGSHNDFYDFPEQYGLKNLLISVDEESVDNLLEEYTPLDLFKFTSEDIDHLASTAYSSLGKPLLNVFTAWHVFHAILAYTYDNVTAS